MDGVVSCIAILAIVLRGVFPRFPLGKEGYLDVPLEVSTVKGDRISGL